MYKPLRKLHDRHLTAIRLHMKGWYQGDIAEHLGVHPSTVSTWFSDSRIKAEIHRRRATALRDAQQILEASSRAAAQYLSAACDPSDPKHKDTNAAGIRAACEILDRTGLVSRDSTTTEDAMSIEEIRDILDQLPAGYLQQTMGES